MPIPFMTLPPLTNPQVFMPQQPAQPRPQSPPKEDVVNAFTTAEPPAAAAAQTPPEAMNAFVTQPDGSQPTAGYAPNPGMYTVSPSARPFSGYSQGVNPYMMVPNPYAAMGASAFPYSYPRNPSGPALVAQTNFRNGYDGRTNTIIERGPAAMPPKPATAAAVDIPQTIASLRTALYPSHREWAANNLALVDWHKHPEVVDALLQVAKEDPAATVRAACVHNLGTMKANTTAVTDGLQALKNDAAPQVVQEVDLVLTQFSTPAKGK